MARKLSRSQQHEWRLSGGGGTDKTRLTHMLPTDDGGAALSWATNVLLYRDQDGSGKFAREGEELPTGDYVLSLVGPIKTEDVYAIRKHERGDTPLLSWTDA